MKDKPSDEKAVSVGNSDQTIVEPERGIEFNKPIETANVNTGNGTQNNGPTIHNYYFRLENKKAAEVLIDYLDKKGLLGKGNFTLEVPETGSRHSRSE